MFYTKIKDAVSAGTLSAAQLADLPALNLSSDNSVAGTISDNASYGVMASYAIVPVPVTVYGGFQHITYMNPSIKLAPGFDDIGGYVLGAVNNTAYVKDDKELNVYWTGARYAVTPQFTAAIAYYGEKQFAYAVGADAGCSNTSQRRVQRQLPRAVRVDRLSFHQALRHLRGRDVVERVTWPRQRVHKHDHGRSHHRRAVLVLIDRSRRPGSRDRLRAMRPRTLGRDPRHRADLASRRGSV